MLPIGSKKFFTFLPNFSNLSPSIIKVLPKALELSKTVKNYGPVQDMMCSYAISEILHSLKGFETISKSYFPKITMQNFSKIEGITTYRVYDYFEDDKPNIFLENQQPKK